MRYPEWDEKLPLFLCLLCAEGTFFAACPAACGEKYATNQRAHVQIQIFYPIFIASLDQTNPSVNFLLQLFGRGSLAIRKALNRGAVISDVRRPHAFDAARIPGSLNIPIDRLSINLERIRAMKRPVIFCGDGGTTSRAVRILKANGITDVYDGGNWQYLIRIARGF